MIAATSPPVTAVTNACSSRACSSRDAWIMRRPSATRRRARSSSLRHAAGLRATSSPISSCPKSNTSCSRSTARSAGVSRSSITRKAIDTCSSASTRSIPACARSIGSGRRSLRSLVAHARRVELVQTEPRHHRDEERLRVLDGDVAAAMPAQPRLLHHVLRARHVAEHAIGERDAARAAAPRTWPDLSSSRDRTSARQPHRLVAHVTRAPRRRRA